MAIARDVIRRYDVTHRCRGRGKTPGEIRRRTLWAGNFWTLWDESCPDTLRGDYEIASEASRENLSAEITTPDPDHE